VLLKGLLTFFIILPFLLSPIFFNGLVQEKKYLKKKLHDKALNLKINYPLGQLPGEAHDSTGLC